MATYSFANILLMERTIEFDAPTASPLEITIPTIVYAGWKTIYPRGFSFGGASGDFIITIGDDDNGGDPISIIASDLDAITQWPKTINSDTVITLQSDTGSDETVSMRWFWANAAVDGIDIGAANGITLPVRTEEITPAMAFDTITIPAGAVELVIETASANAFDYRVDDGDTDGSTVTIDSADVSPSVPYRIYVNDGDRLQMQQNGGAINLQGYWRIG